jgi:hypothetical protein
MKQAFASPEYNDYMRERLDLQRVIMRRYETGSPISLVSVIYRVHPSNDIHLYADKLILDGNRSGDLSKYREVIGFAQRFYLGASTDLEQNVARNLLQRCMAILAPKLKGQGHDEEAEQMAFQVAAIQKYTKSLIENRSEYLLNRTASIIHLATLFSILASLMIAGAFVAWVISRLRKTSTRAATAIMTGGVMVLMSSLAIVYISYRPYQQIYAQFVDGGFVPPKVLSGFGPILNVPFFVFRMTPSFSEEVLLWQIVLVTGTGALAVIAARHLRAWRGGHAS